ncbi:hypothetical protein [Streptomyces sp. NPDC088739]|uniref:hypothetical protein n=1 Tax=Streptomyces sp. NPDC088739 TaxID=3365882 RepID=UPI0038127E82
MSDTEWGISPDPLADLRRRFAAVRESGDGDQLLALLAVIPQARTRLDQMEAELTDAARAAGVPWARIAGPLGLATRQAAETRALRLRQTLVTGRSDQAARRAYVARQRDVADLSDRPHSADA